MKNYKKVQVKRIKDMGKYVTRKIRQGYVIIDVSLNDAKNEIVEVTSYANDRNCASYYYRYLAGSDDYLRANIMIERLEPILKLDEEEPYTDIYWDDQDFTTFDDLESIFKDWTKDSVGECSYHYHSDLYISKAPVELGDFGGPLELEFIDECVIGGYYNVSSKPYFTPWGQ